MSRISIPGLIDVLRVDEANQIEALANDARMDRQYAPRGPLINRIILKRIRRVLAIDGVPLPPVAPRGHERPLAAQSATETWLDGLAESGFDPDDIAALAGWVKGDGKAPVGPIVQQAVGRLFARGYDADAASWAAAEVMGRAPSDFNPLRMLLWGVTRRVERARALLSEKVGGDATGVHATGVAIHNMVSGLEAMRLAYAEPEARGRLSVSAAVSRAVVAPAQVVRQPTAAGRSGAGAFSADTLVLLRLEKANRADPGYDTAFMDGAWSQCPARRWVPALYAAVWRAATAGESGGEGRGLMANDVIFSPLKFRNLEVKNRIFRSSISGRFDNEDGSPTQTRINWESKFAAGGVGAIISSYVPVAMEGRIIAGYGTIHRDEWIPLWAKLGEAVHAHGSKFIMQLSHSGRQLDLPGIHNKYRKALSSTSKTEPINGIACRAMDKAEIAHVVQQFADGAWRAREAGLDGVELHSANGYLFTQFLSSGINDRTDEYGGSLENRARFLLEVIAAIRARVGSGYHLQVKLGGVDHNNVIPFEKVGNSIPDAVQIAKWCEAAGVDGIHVSSGSSFPHPLNPPGDFPLDLLATTYDTMISSSGHGLRNYLLFRYKLLQPLFHWLWFRLKRGHPVEGVSLDEARQIKAAVLIPVIVTGGFQTASVIANAIDGGVCDGVAIARSLIANNDLVEIWRAGAERPDKPCTYCNKCLVNAPKNPLGCYEQDRYPDYDTMVRTIMSIYSTHADLRVPAREGLLTR